MGTHQNYQHIVVTAEPTGFGAAISGLELSKPLPSSTIAEIEQAFARHKVVYFPDQPLDHDQLEGFTQAFGTFGHDPFIEPLADRPHILEIRREATETARNFGAGWHSDWSFQAAPPMATLLHAKVVPPVGGDTLYADAARAYDALSPVMKTLLAPLVTIHSARLPYGAKGAFATETAKRSMKIITGVEAEKTQRHPLVRTHPVTGAKSLFISPTYTIGIDGMTEYESQALLSFLYQHMTQPDFIYRHHWRANMLTMWDNRCTLHCAEGGYDGHLRVMHRTTIAGTVPV
jgi:taurine dioxygenase